MTRGEVIIIGAPRSGTNMLRDLLSSRPGVVTWPCDEINAVWRHGSRDHPTDEIPVDRADRRLQHYISSRFDRVRRRQGGHTVVEKTCANSLRVDYVAALLPRARFVLITRDGVDATASALARWNAPVDWSYTVRKARFVPPSDLAYSGLRFATNRVLWRGTSDTWTRSWGPRFDGIDEMLRSRSLDEVCAAQWRRCIERSYSALERLPCERVHRLRYEDFVRRPEDGLVELLRFLDLPTVDLESAVAGVSASSIGRGHLSLEASKLARVQEMLSPTLGQLGYV